MQNLAASEFTGVPCYHSIINSESETYAANFKNQEFSVCLSTPMNIVYIDSDFTICNKQ